MRYVTANIQMFETDTGLNEILSNAVVQLELIFIRVQCVQTQKSALVFPRLKNTLNVEDAYQYSHRPISNVSFAFKFRLRTTGIHLLHREQHNNFQTQPCKISEIDNNRHKILTKKDSLKSIHLTFYTDLTITIH